MERIDVSKLAGSNASMIPYLLLMCATGFFALQVGSGYRDRVHLGLGMVVVLVLMIGLRHQVGGDWFNYQKHYDVMIGQPFSAVLADSEPAYALMNWLSAQLDWNQYGTNLFCAIFFTIGLWRFCLAQPSPQLALAVSVPYLVMIVAMGYTRQGVAIGFALLALLALEKKSFFVFGAWIVCAALFHKTAVVLLALGVLVSSGGWWWRLPAMFVIAYMAYDALLADSVDAYLQSYEEAGYASSGAAIRVAMNVLPAIVFLRWRKQFMLPPVPLQIWTLLALASLAMVPALLLANSSTAVDRIALYLIPVQLFVWSRVPLVWAEKHQMIRQYVVAYSLAVMLVWLFFADHSYAWLPYQFYPIVWLF